MGFPGVHAVFKCPGRMRAAKDGARVAVAVDGERYEGTVERSTHTPKGGQRVLAVVLDRSPPDGRERIAVHAEAVEGCDSSARTVGEAVTKRRSVG